MTMVRLHRSLRIRAVGVSGTLLAVLLAVVGSESRLWGQTPVRHGLHAGVMPPGAIGGLRLQQGEPLSSYFQPVRIRAPQGARIALAQHAAFLPAHPAPLQASLRVGSVYRLKVTHIPGRPGSEVYPTIELIDRLYPPAGQAWRFPIPVDLTFEELELAAVGRLVTRVIYVEDPNRAVPHQQAGESTRWFEVAPGEDPLLAADAEGRPVAILRLGGRLPDASGNDPQFFFGSPPVREIVDGSHKPNRVGAPTRHPALPRTHLPEPAAEPQVPAAHSTDPDTQALTDIIQALQAQP